MTDRPIIFSAPMVRALLAGRKTQTRRLATSPLRRVEAGDRLYVRERGWRSGTEGAEAFLPYVGNESAEALYVGDQRMKSTPSIHMPRWASRLTLIVEAVRFQRLQEISDNDALAEGLVEYPADMSPSYWGVDTLPSEARRLNPGNAFAQLWQSLHTADGERWQDNPEIVALTFRVERGNIDQIARAA